MFFIINNWVGSNIHCFYENHDVDKVIRGFSTYFGGRGHQFGVHLGGRGGAGERLEF